MLVPSNPATSPAPVFPADGSGPSAPTLRKRHSASTLIAHGTTAPPRPPRNPARPSVAQPKPKKSKRPATATGTREEVTPWEFFPANAEELPVPTAAESARQAAETATGKREDVLPWELFPTPDYDATAANSATNGHIKPQQTNHTRQPRPSTSSSSILSFQDMALLRRRKSTGTKAVRASVVPPIASGSGLANGTPRASTSTANPHKSPSSSPKVLHKTPSSATVRPPLPHASSGPAPPISSAETISPPFQPRAPPPPPAPAPGTPSAPDPKFSTADRTILKELKRNISARAAQFVIKGGPAESGRAASGASLTRLGSRHHAYNREEVPYPRSYVREVLDLDVWETMACQRICDSLTWHVFPTPPTKVLDIGCGTGTWILNCGMAWRHCHFVGLDVVPLQPDLGASELASRITWVHANFLEGLPFPNDEFDFVHIKRIALGVPEDKWDTLFEEISRVLKSGGAFELIDEDLFFPGKPSDDDEDSDSDVTSELRYARSGSVNSDGEHDDDESVITGSGGSRLSHDGFAQTPNTSIGAIPVTPPRTASPLPMLSGAQLLREEVIVEAAEEAGLHPATQKAPPPHRHSYQLRTPSRTPSLSLSPNSPRLASSSTTSLLGSLGSPASADRRNKRGYSTSTLMQHPSVLALPQGSYAKPAFAPFLLRTLPPKAPPNPRDHSMLEGIYNEMNATRFINLSPLSLLANLVGLHFKDVRTHPPLQLTFPPPPAQPPLDEPEITSDDDSDSDNARNAIIPSPRRRQSLLPNTTASSPPNTPRGASYDESITDEQRWVGMKDLLKRESRYITLDDARMSAFSPSTRSSFPAISPPRSVNGLPVLDPPVPSGVGPSEAPLPLNGKAPVPPSGKAPVRGQEQKNRLPNSTLNIDVRSLNMHLAVRTAEILGCAESMWEWVVSYQHSYEAERKAGRPRAGSLASELVPHSSRLAAVTFDPATDAFKSAVLELTREDFDSLLVNFEIDMQDNMAIGSTLRDQFSWPCVSMAPSQERKVFLAACDRWQQWKAQQRRKVKLADERPPARNSIDTLYHSPGHEANGFGPKADLVRERKSLSESVSQSTASSSSSTIPPERRLSRSIRVFVAWKS
ncbi:hypothetical protein B0H15DRAFT_1019865 [Mycena belliarum]|uniref:Methyltransferase domain-containing protein n=1 Tax=Mycena belliarum TaxID=1033014 RepID=A0AAD6UC50_9AGAR|nr:hypothetical protein B0H15DRAFT_1019865 [Mycena belliae]